MSDTKTIRFVCTYPRGQTDADREALALHRAGIGPETGARTLDQTAHRAQVSYRRVGWNGAPIYEITCQACGIRWRND